MQIHPSYNCTIRSEISSVQKSSIILSTPLSYFIISQEHISLLQMIQNNSILSYFFIDFSCAIHLLQT